MTTFRGGADACLQLWRIAADVESGVECWEYT